MILYLKHDNFEVLWWLFGVLSQSEGKLELNYEKSFKVPMECKLHCHHPLSCSCEEFLFLKIQIFHDALIQFKKKLI